MKKVNKKGMELSINTVVIIVLAVALLVVAIGFITGFLPSLFDMTTNFPKLTIEPTINDPITFAASNFVKGKDNTMTVGFYNNEATDVNASTIPTIVCSGLEGLMVNAIGQPVPVSQTAKYEVVVRVPAQVQSGTYPCTVTISQTVAQYTINIK